MLIINYLIQGAAVETIAREDVLRQSIDQFWDSVPASWNQIRCHLRQIASEQFNISVEQFHVLRLIRRGLTSVSMIADSRQTSRPAVSQAAEILVRRGYITRRQEENDRRYVHLALTPAGEDLLNQIHQQNRAWMMEKMSGLSAGDLARITEGLALLKSAFDPSLTDLTK
jgi:DNA-binding MarR family transcriptional regulator